MTKYIIIVALGAISYGTLTSFAKIAYGQGYTAGEITFAQAIIGAIILWSVVLFRSIKNRSFKLAGNWKLILAGNLLNVNDLNFSFTGIALALSSAFLYTIYVLSTSRLGNETPMFEKSALMTTGSAMMILLINFQSITTSTHLDFGLLKWGTFLAIFGTVIPPICFTTGMPKIGASLSAILLTLELPAVVFCAHIILGEQVTFLQIIGIAIMIGVIIWLNLVKTKREKKTAELTT